MSFGRASAVDHESSYELDYDFPPLIDPPTAHGDDSNRRTRLRFPGVGDLGLGPQGVTDKNRIRERDVGPAKVGGGVLARVRVGEAGDQREGEAGVDERLTKLGAFGVLVVEMNLIRIERELGEPLIVGLGNCSPESALEDIAYIQVFEEPAAPDLLGRLEICLIS